MRKFKLLLLGSLVGLSSLQAQVTFPENGISDPRHGHYAFTNATVVKDATTTLTNATLVIKDGRITAVGSGLKVPAGAVEITAQETKDVNLTSVQRVTFGHKFDERLKVGNYVVGIYCDRGLLGSATFKLGK